MLQNIDIVMLVLGCFKKSLYTTLELLIELSDD